MKALNLTLLVLESQTAKTIDLMIMRIHGQKDSTTVFIDESGDFKDPDVIMPELAR